MVTPTLAKNFALSDGYSELEDGSPRLAIEDGYDDQDSDSPIEDAYSPDLSD